MLKPENRPIYEDVRHYLNTHGKCILITHPGRGKSFITDEYVQEEQLNDVLCICPRVAIAKQWEDQHSDAIRTMTYAAFAKLDISDIGHPDLVIIDEAHHAGAPKWGRIIPQIIANANASGTKVLGLTADPIRWTDKARDVGEEFFDGCQVYGPTVTESISEGFLQSFTYVLSMYGVESKIDKLREKAKTLPEDIQDEAFTLIGKMKYLPDTVLDTVKCLQTYTKPGNHKVIVFCSRIKDIPDAQSLIAKAYPDMQQFVMHTGMSDSKSLAEFRKWQDADNACIFNIDKISEGVHASGADVVIMFRKTGSPSLYAQQVGRGISPDNPDAVVFDIVSNAGNIAKVLKRAGFKETEEGDTVPIDFRKGGVHGERPSPKQIVIKNLARPAADALHKIELLTSSCRPWSEWEEAYIMKNRTVMTPAQMHDDALPWRTPSAIISKLHMLDPDYRTTEPPVIPWTPTRTEWAVKFYKEGKTLEYISKLMSVTQDDLASHLKDNGVILS